MMVAMLALLRQCGAFRAPAASRLAPTRLLSVSPRIYESSSAAPASYALPVSDALLARVPESVRARDADVVEAYLLDALQLGLGALERVEGAGEARRVAAEFDSLVSRLDTWDARLRERLDSAFATRDARTTAALESYLGSKGRLEATIDGLRVNLSDPTRSTSLVSATAASVSQALEKTTADVRRLLDCADSSSELGKFLAQQREVVASQRGVQAAATAEFVGELRSAYKDLDARLARTLEAVGAEDVRRADVKGRAFELDVYDSLLALASVGGDGVEDTAYEAAAGSRSKVGDALVTLQGGAASVAVEVKSGKFAMAGATSLERSLRDAMDLRGAQAAIGVVRAKHLGKRMGWYTALPGNVVVVAFEPDVRAPGVLRANLSSEALSASPAGRARRRRAPVRVQGAPGPGPRGRARRARRRRRGRGGAPRGRDPPARARHPRVPGPAPPHEEECDRCGRHAQRAPRRPRRPRPRDPRRAPRDRQRPRRGTVGLSYQQQAKAEPGARVLRWQWPPDPWSSPAAWRRSRLRSRRS